MNRILLVLILLLNPVVLYAKFNHIGPKDCVKADHAMDCVAEKLAKTYQLQLITSSCGVLIDSKKALWARGFIARYPATIEQVRPIIADMSRTILWHLYHDPVYATAKKHTLMNRQPLGNQLVGFKLAFWDSNMDRPLAPFLAQVKFVDGKIHYYYADPKTQALQEPLVEELEALKITPEQYQP